LSFRCLQSQNQKLQNHEIVSARLCLYNRRMTSLARARILWLACVLLFAAAAIGLRWGAQISIALMPSAQRVYADADLLHGMWVKRAISLFVLSAICGIAGIYYGLRASDARPR
jgi:hypothetical protein